MATSSIMKLFPSLYIHCNNSLNTKVHGKMKLKYKNFKQNLLIQVFSGFSAIDFSMDINFSLLFSKTSYEKT